MAKIIAPSARTTLYNGVHGNQSVAVLGASLAAAAAGDVVVLGEFDGHPTITDFRLDHANLGAGTSVDIGFAYSSTTADEPDVIADGLATASAGSKRMAQKPVEAKEKFCQVVATVKGGTATGELSLTLGYTNRG